MDIRSKLRQTLSAIALICLLAMPGLAHAQIYGWGNNGAGELGDGSFVDRHAPVLSSGPSGLIAVSAGKFHRLSLRSNGTVWATGYNLDGEIGDGTTFYRSTPAQVSGLTGAIAIAAGSYHSLALRSDGTVWSWGYNSDGQLGDGTNTTRKTPVQVSGLSGVTAIAACGYFSLALKSDGTVWSWGYNSSGQLGNGSTSSRNTPGQVSGLTSVVSIAAAGSHGLAVKLDGTVRAWGWNYFGQLGDGSTTDRLTPVTASGLSNITAVAGGTAHTIALRSDGVVLAWGYGLDGELGDGTTTNWRVTPAAVSGLTGVTGISSGFYHNLARRTDGTVWAWGDNSYGQLGDGSTSQRLTPKQVGGVSDAASVSAGGWHSADLHLDYTITTVRTWGYNADGELGTGSLVWRYAPGPVDGQLGVAGVAAGGHFTLILRGMGTVWTCGDNRYGQLCDGTTTLRMSPVQAVSLNNIVAVTAGYTFGGALRSDGTVWTWGDNSLGQLGDGTNTNRSVPVQVSGLNNVIAIGTSAVADHMLALKSDGTVWGWGSNHTGELGDGTTIMRTTPVQVQGLAGITAIAGGGGYSLALRNDGSVWGWGFNTSGQLGDGTVNSTTTPVQVAGLTGVTAIAAGQRHSLAVRSDGTAWSWGFNDDGELGDGTTVERHTPAQIPGLSGVTKVYAGYAHSIAMVREVRGLRAWGWNQEGELGDGGSTNKLSPVRVIGVIGVTAISCGFVHNAAIVTPSPVDAGQDQTIKAAHGGNPATDTATFTIDGSGSFDPNGGTLTYQWNEGANVIGTTAALTLNRKPGAYLFTLTISNGVNLTASASTHVTVLPADNQAPVAAPQSVSTLLETATNITLIATDGDNDTLAYGVTTLPSHGTLTGTAPNVTYTPATGYVGPDSFTFRVYDGYVYSNTATITLDVAKQDTTVIVTDQRGYPGGAVTLKASLMRNGDGLFLSGKPIAFKVGDTTLDAAITNVNGIATVSYTIPASTAIPSTLSVSAAFAGDTTYNANSSTGTLTVGKQTTITSASISGSVGAAVTLKGTLKAGTVVIPNANIEFFVDDASVGTAVTSSTGSAGLSHVITEAAGVHKLTAKFAGDSANAPSTSIDYTLTVKKLDTKTSPSAVAAKIGATATLKATVKAGTIAVTGATVTFKINSVAVGAGTTDSTGLATTTYVVPEGVGTTQTITAEYAGDGTHNASSGTAALTIQAAATKLTGEVLTKPAGSTVDLGAKLTRTTDSAVLAGKTVKFYDSTGATLIGTATTDAAGRASISVTAPAKGVTVKYKIVFPGDTNYATSSGTASVKGT